MSRQLAISAAFSIVAMAVYVLFGGNAIRATIDGTAEAAGSRVEVSTVHVLPAERLLPLLAH